MQLTGAAPTVVSSGCTFVPVCVGEDVRALLAFLGAIQPFEAILCFWETARVQS